MKSAQSLLVLAVLLLLGLNFAVEGIFSWVFLITIPLAGYYALTMHRTGYALGENHVYQRNKNPFMYRVHFWSAIVLVFAALCSCLY